MKANNPTIVKIVLQIALLFTLFVISTQGHAAMYKYITKDGQTLLTGEKLKGGGHKLVKIFKLKKSYKSSSAKKISKKNKSSYKKKSKSKKKSYKKSRKTRKSQNRKRKSLGNIVKANGRDNGIIIGCGNDKHLSKQARVYQKPIQIYSRIYDVDEELIHAIVKQESCFNEGAHSRVGAIGLMQLMPQTALGLRINDPWNPEHNIQGGVKYIAEMLSMFKGNYKLAIAAYNAGPGNVRKYDGIPPFKETRNYVVKVYGEYKRLKKEGISYNKIQLAAK